MPVYLSFPVFEWRYTFQTAQAKCAEVEYGNENEKLVRPLYHDQHTKVWSYRMKLDVDLSPWSV